MEGWNDPPKNVGEPTGQLKINLNKRVAFPLSSTPPVATHEGLSEQPTLLPPMSPPKADLFSRISNSASDEVESKRDDDEELCKKAYSILKVAAHELENPAQDIIIAKLESFEDDWKKCDKNVKALLIELTDYLIVEDFKNTAAVHRKIVLKGFNRPWIASIRQIFTGLEKLKEKDKDDSTLAIVNPIDIPNEELNTDNVN